MPLCAQLRLARTLEFHVYLLPFENGYGGVRFSIPFPHIEYVVPHFQRALVLDLVGLQILFLKPLL